MRLVDHHALEAEATEPADVPVKHLVVDDHDIAERVDVIAIAVHHGRGSLRGPQGHLTRPVRLDDVGYDDQQRVRIGDRRREQRLGGLAEAGLVGEQEGAVTGFDFFEEPRLVTHQLEFARGLQRTGLWQVHAGRTASGTVLEGAEQRFDELPVGELVDARRPGLNRTEVGCEERVGHLQLANRLGNDLPLGGEVFGCGLGRDDQFVRAQLHTCGEEKIAAKSLRGGGHRSIIRQQGDQAGVARRRLGEDAREAVEALLLVGALSLVQARIRLDASTLLAQQQGGHLEPGTIGRFERTLLHGRLDLARGTGEHGNDALVIGPAGAPSLLGRRGTIAAVTAVAASRSLTLARLSRSRCQVCSPRAAPAA